MKMIKEFVKMEAAGGILLCAAALVALIMKNSAAASIYDQFLSVVAGIKVGSFIIDKPLLLWINDGLMAVFFLLIGLEIKREMLEDNLSTRKQVTLPIIAAIGGLIVPALIYSYFNWSNPDAMKGWAIPAATDIAFAIGAISLLGKRVPESLKICLVAIAIIDDLAAIVIIAIFYTNTISLVSIGFALVAVLILSILNRKNVTKLSPYIIAGIFLWLCVLKSGVHATLSGVTLAMAIPMRDNKDKKYSPLKKLEHDLHPWVAFMVLPIFAFANAGVSLAGVSVNTLLNPITLGIALGLFVGKQLGVMFFTIIGLLTKVCSMPKGVNIKQFYGMSLLTGIGFTMSLFIGTLAFDDYATQNFVRLGVLSGSLLSAVIGYNILAYTSKSKK